MQDLLTFPFPSPSTTLGIVFSLLLLAPLAAASWIDLKTLRIPKRLTIGLFFSGVVVSLVRGAWLGAQGQSVWVLGWSSVVPGAIEGFLFSLCGALVAFVVFFGLWATGIFLGGGDVKLVTATATWLGPWGVLLAALCSLAVFSVIGLGRIAYEISQGVMPSLAPRAKDAKRQGKAGRSRISYSLSFCLGTAAVLAYALRHELGWVGPIGS